KSPPRPRGPHIEVRRRDKMRLASRPRAAMLRARSGASILHCDRDALHAAVLSFTTMQKQRVICTVGDAQAKFIRMKSTSKKRTPGGNQMKGCPCFALMISALPSPD